MDAEIKRLLQRIEHKFTDLLTNDERVAIAQLRQGTQIEKTRNKMGDLAIELAGLEACIADALGYLCEARMAKTDKSRDGWILCAKSDIETAERIKLRPPVNYDLF